MAKKIDKEIAEMDKILDDWMAGHMREHKKMLPHLFYTELFRLNGWDFSITQIRKHQRAIIRWIATLIYNQKFDPTGKPVGLKLDTGDKELDNQIQQITTLFRVSDNMEDMYKKYEKIQDPKTNKIEAPFEFDEKGQTKEPIYEEKDLSDFNQKLKTALNYKANKGQ